MAVIDPALIAHASAVLRRGGVVVYPTDTFYGLAVDPRMPDAVARLFALKGRIGGQAPPLIACDEHQAEAAVHMDEPAQRLARAFWPGPLSIVLAAREAICPDARAADGTIAVRVPASDVARALARTFGFCVTATSANRSGEPPSTSAAGVADMLASGVDFILDGGETPGGAPSTLVDVRGEPRLVRAGAVPWDRVLRSIE